MGQISEGGGESSWSVQEYVLESILRDEEFVLYRARHRNQADIPSVLVRTPISTRPAPESLKRIEHEYSFRADRPNEPFDRFPERSLRLRRLALPNADRQSALHGFRSDGVGALPHCKTAGAAWRTIGGCPELCLCNHHETARQNC